MQTNSTRVLQKRITESMKACCDHQINKFSMGGGGGIEEMPFVFSGYLPMQYFVSHSSSLKIALSIHGKSI